MSFETLRKPNKTAVHLWEFLLDLLLDEKCGHMICWINREAGEFKLKNQEEVARRWGCIKHRPGMNYDKLSRALRYYYQKGIIKKVNGQRLAYKFVKPPFGKSKEPAPQNVPAQTNINAPSTTQETKKEGEVKIQEVENKEGAAIPVVPCVRTAAVTLPQTSVTTASMGFRIIQAPLVSPNHMTCPISIYPYVVPCVIPACRPIEIIKS